MLRMKCLHSILRVFVVLAIRVGAFALGVVFLYAFWELLGSTSTVVCRSLRAHLGCYQSYSRFDVLFEDSIFLGVGIFLIVAAIAIRFGNAPASKAQSREGENHVSNAAPPEKVKQSVCLLCKPLNNDIDDDSDRQHLNG